MIPWPWRCRAPIEIPDFVFQLFGVECSRNYCRAICRSFAELNRHQLKHSVDEAVDNVRRYGFDVEEERKWITEALKKSIRDHDMFSRVRRTAVRWI